MAVLAALVLPILPGVLWMWLVYRTDHFEPEPIHLVLATFVLGAAAVLPAFGVERLVNFAWPFLHTIDRAAEGQSADQLVVALGCFLVVGPVEELAKFATVRLYIFRHPEFDEPLDGIIYASAAALGVASLVNLLYVIDFDRGWHLRWGALGLRSMLALPGHIIFAAVWGAALGRRRFDPNYPVAPRVVLAAFLHGLYDFLLVTPMTRSVILLYMSIMGALVVREIHLLRADSPFAPWAKRPPAAPPPTLSSGGDGPGAGAT